MKNMRFFTLMMVCFFFLLTSPSSSQSNPEIDYTSPANAIAPSPQSAEFAKYATEQVSLHTGIPDISIPIYTLEGSSLSLPISLSYHAGGIKVEDEGSWVGLGWNLNYGGVVTRTIMGAPDNDSPNGYWHNSIGNEPTFQDYNNDENAFYMWLNELSMCDLYDLSHNEEGNAVSLDYMPDIFYVNFPQGTAKIVFTPDENGDGYPDPHISPYRPWIVKYLGEESGISITTENGILYEFSENETFISEYEASGSMILPKSSSGTSSWYLKNITSLNTGEQITLSYVNQSYETTSFIPDVTEFKAIPLQTPIDPFNCTPTGPEDGNDIVYYTSYKTFVSPICTSMQSSSSKFKVLLEWDNSRTDIESTGNKSKLNKISVQLAESNVEIKSFDFVYDYFLSTPGTSDPMKKRLKLLSIREYGANDEPLNPAPYDSYKFTYDESGPLPAKNSKKQDHWGYYSENASSTNMIPEMLYQANFYAGSNRSTDPETVILGLLTKIQYPTGGYHEFFYEANRFKKSGPGAIYDVGETTVMVSTNDPGEIGDDCPDIDQFTVPFDQYSKLTYSLFTDLTDPPSGVLRLKNSSGLVLWTGTHNEEGIHQSSIYLKSGETYTICADVDIEGDVATLIVTTYFDNSGGLEAEEYAGGCRVWQTKKYDGIDHNNDQIMKYQYVDDEEESSGVLISKPVYYSKQYKAVICDAGGLPSKGGDYDYFTRHSVSQAHLGSTQGSHIGYTKVTTLYGSNGENGKEEHYFTSAVEFGDTGGKSYPFGPGESLGDLRGFLLNKKTYRKNSQSGYDLVAELNNTYTYNNNPGLPNYSYIYGLKVAEKKSGIVYDGNLCPTGNTWDYFSYPYKIFIFWPLLTTTESKIYGSDGSLVTQTEETFSYENSIHAQLTKKESTNSDGVIHTQKIRYTRDLINGYIWSPTSLTSADPYMSYAIDEMVFVRNMLNFPVEEVNYIRNVGETEDKIVSGQITEYKVFDNNIVAPYMRFQIETSSPISIGTGSNKYQYSSFSYGGSTWNFGKNSKYILRQTIDKYDLKGNVLEMHVENDVPISIQWGHNRILPVAQFKNAHRNDAISGVSQTYIGNEASFTSFESLSSITTSNIAEEDNWKFSTNDQELVTSESHSGNKCLWVKAGGSATGPYRDFLPERQDQKYKFSAWIKTESGYSSTTSGLLIHTEYNPDGTVGPSVSGSSVTVTLNSSTDNIWQYVEAIIDLPAVKAAGGVSSNLYIRCKAVNYDAGKKFLIDDMRFQPVESLAKTVTYDASFFQTASESDENSTPVYYEYDNFGRLEWVLDQDKNVLNRTQYFYNNPTGKNQIYSQSLLAEGYDKTEVISGSVAGSDIKKQYRFFDGLGRPIQTVDYKQSPEENDVVSYVTYDVFSREVKKKLPFTAASVSGIYHTGYETEQSTFYTSQANVAHSSIAFAETAFEPSPINRVTEQAAPGYSWKMGSGHTNRITYRGNETDEVHLFFEISHGNWTADDSYYQANELSVEEYKDEHGKLKVVYKDKQGKLICELTQKSTPCGGCPIIEILTENLSYYTLIYYVYDEFGRLIFSIQPEGIKTLHDDATNPWDLTADIKDKYTFQYSYDSRGRMITKEVPGSASEYFIYDKLNRVVLTQDGNLRQNDKWKFTKYDMLSRPIIVGQYIDATHTTRTSMQTYADGFVNGSSTFYYEKRSGTSYNSNQGYTNQAFPSHQSGKVLSVKYYDDYDFNLNGSNDYVYDATSGLGTPFYRLKNKVTGVKERMYEISGNTTQIGSDWLTSIDFYDKQGRIIQSQKNNHLNIGSNPLMDVTNTIYDFTGNIIENKSTVHAGNGSNTVNNEFIYDHAKRLTSTKQQNNSDAEVILAQNKYNELGQQIEKNLYNPNTSGSGNYWQSIDYTYNIRGWLTSINNADLTTGGSIKILDPCFQSQLETILGHTNPTNGEYAEALARSVTWMLDVQGYTDTEFAQFAASGTNDAKNGALAFFGQSGPESRTVLNDAYSFSISYKPNRTSCKNALKSNILSKLNELSGTPTLDQKNAKSVEGIIATMVTGGTLSFFDPTADFYPDLFGMQLYYDGGNSSVGGDAQFNGNISWVKWKVQGETDQQYYGYKYDHLNRITQANYKDFSNCTWSNIDRYSMPAVSYDDNGNILTLQQKGLIDATPSNVFDLMDNLQYFYSGNRLIGVHDAVADHADMNDFADYGQEGTIVEGTTSTHEYLYDNNGNMKKDNGKGITSIVYNSLNLPAIVMYGSTKRVEYTYTASGEKVKQRIVNTTSSIVKHYISGFNYEEVAGTPTLQYFGTREGRVINDAGTLKYEFNLTDHLGNVRVSFRDIDGQAGIDKDDITDRDDYYPYGLTFAGLATIVQSENPYEYNGKELQNGPNGKILNWNDYGSRMYDPQVGRWIVVDPMAEHSYAMSPFLYANSNPVNFYDPDGKLPLPLITGAIGGVIGAAVAGGLAASQGKPWKAAAAGGFAAGFITGSGAGLLTGLAAPAAAGLTAGIGFISASVGSAVTQTGELLAGDRKDISTEELAFDGLIGIPSSFMGNAGSQSLSKSILKRYGKGFKEVLMDNGMKNKEAKKVIQALNEYIGNNKNKALDAVEVTVKTGSIVVTEAAVSTTTEPVKEAILENKEEK